MTADTEWAEIDGTRCAAWHWTTTASTSTTVIPDGTADLMWTPGRPPWIACPDTGPARSSVELGAPIVGVRLAPGALAALAEQSAARLIDRRLSLDALTTDADARLLTARLDDVGIDAAAQRLSSWVTQRLGPGWQPDAAVVAEVRRIRTCGTAAPSGLGPRQLRRRFSDAIGYGPKFFEKVCRWERFVDQMTRQPDESLATAAAHAGYADQSHLSRDCRTLTGQTPARFMAAPARE